MADTTEVVLIDDEWSRATSDEYAAALAAWIREADAREPVATSVSAAEVLHRLRIDGES